MHYLLTGKLKNACKNNMHNFKKLEIIKEKNNNLKKNKNKSLYDLKIYITNMSYMFYGCSNLLYLLDISNWNISKVNNMSCMFSGCNSLFSLPDKSDWDTSNVKLMNKLFYECSH